MPLSFPDALDKMNCSSWDKTQWSSLPDVLSKQNEAEHAKMTWFWNFFRHYQRAHPVFLSPVSYLFFLSCLTNICISSQDKTLRSCFPDVLLKCKEAELGEKTWFFRTIILELGQRSPHLSHTCSCLVSQTAISSHQDKTQGKVFNIRQDYLVFLNHR